MLSSHRSYEIICQGTCYVRTLTYTMMRLSDTRIQSVSQIRCYETTGRPVFITVVLHRRIPYLKNLVGQVAPQALPDACETTKFLF